MIKLFLDIIKLNIFIISVTHFFVNYIQNTYTCTLSHLIIFFLIILVKKGDKRGILLFIWYMSFICSLIWDLGCIYRNIGFNKIRTTELTFAGVDF